MRALAFAAAPILLIALVAGVGLRLSRVELFGLVLNPFVLSSVFVLNLVVLVYRLVAIVDAYRVAEYMNLHAGGGDGRLAGSRRARNPLSIAGLLAVLLVMAGSHVVVARYDMLALDVLDSGCIFIGDEQADPECDADATPSPGSSATPTRPGSVEPTDTPEPIATPAGSALPDVTIPPWDGKERLNILLIGSDKREGDRSYNTDTLIVVSIDPVTKQVAMFSLPRDTVDVPTPPGPARSAFGSVYTRKINAWLTQVRGRSDLFPGNSATRGYNGLKAILGNLYGLDIKYFVEVDFEGFKNVVDALGGVTINVQVPVSDDRFPATEGGLPTGLHPERDPAHDRGRGAPLRPLATHLERLRPRPTPAARAHLAARAGRSPGAHPAPARARVRAQEGGQDRHPGRPAGAAPRARLGCRHEEHPVVRVHAAVLPEGIPVQPARLHHRPVREQDPGSGQPRVHDRPRRRGGAPEAGPGGGPGVGPQRHRRSRPAGRDVAGYLEYHGLAASAPRQKPPGAVPANTKIVVYNGAERAFPDTIAYLEETFGVKVTEVTDPAIRTDIIVTIGRSTPDLEAPISP